MTREQAYEKLELTDGADLQLVRKQFAKLHNDFQVRIDNAPTPKLKQAFERGQEELKEAYTLLNGSESVDDTSSLPHNERSFEQSDGPTAPEVEKTLSVDQALSMFGVSRSYTAKEIEAAIKQRMVKLKEQYQAADLAAAKDAYKQEISKLEKAQKIILNWLAEKKQAEQAKQAKPRQSTPASAAAAPQKKSKVWLLLLPLVLIAGGVVYYLSQQTQKATPERPQSDLTAVRDSSAWRTALAATSENGYKYYLSEYPSGIFAQAARDSLAKIAGAKAATKTAGADANQQQLADQQARIQEPELQNKQRVEKERLAAAERKRQEDARKAAVPVPQMVRVAGGSFQMGSSDWDDDETPIHTVRLSSYSIGKYEVTFEEYDAFCNATGRRKPVDNGWGRGRRPVINVSWNDAVAYCNWLSGQTGQTFRLPTEAEWEFAARGGNNSRGTTYSGSNSINSVAWYEDNAGEKIHPVGQKSANELGLYDMSGNVLEWCSDRFGKNYYSSSPVSNPKGPGSGEYRVLRGGCWYYSPSGCRVSRRLARTPENFDNLYGFRVASSE